MVYKVLGLALDLGVLLRGEYSEILFGRVVFGVFEELGTTDRVGYRVQRVIHDILGDLY